MITKSNNYSRPNFSSKNGFTLIEIMIVVAIVAILAIMAMFMMTNNLGKSRDGRRKADLDRLKIAFEDYYGDKNIFPPGNILETCGGEGLRPYLSEIPCDPKQNKPYCYIYDVDGNGQNFKILGSLEFASDPVIAELSCDNDNVYCGYEAECAGLGYGRFNYGVTSSDLLVVNEDIGSMLPTPTPTPFPSTNPGSYACSAQGVCNSYANPTGSPNFCPLTFSNEVQCDSYCPTSPVNARCAL